MNLRERWLRAPDGTEGGGAPPADKGADGGKPAAPAKGEFDTRPDWLPEHFYNPETKGPRIKEMAKAWGDLRTKVAKGVETYKAEYEAQEAERIAKIRPMEPTGYRFAANPEKHGDLVILEEAPGEDFKPEKGKQYAVLNPKDPMMQWWQKTAHEKGLSHEQYSDGIVEFLRAQSGKQPDFEAEMKKLGENASDRVKQVDGWMRGNLSEAAYRSFENFAQTAAGIEAIETLIAAAGGPKLGAKPTASGSPASSATTPAQVRDMIKDPRWWDSRRRDPAYVKEVEEAYKRAFPGQTQTSVSNSSR